MDSWPEMHSNISTHWYRGYHDSIECSPENRNQKLYKCMLSVMLGVRGMSNSTPLHTALDARKIALKIIQQDMGALWQAHIFPTFATLLWSLPDLTYHLGLLEISKELLESYIMQMGGNGMRIPSPTDHGTRIRTIWAHHICWSSWPGYFPPNPLMKEIWGEPCAMQCKAFGGILLFRIPTTTSPGHPKRGKAFLQTQLHAMSL